MAGLCDFADIPVTHGAVAVGAARQGTRFHKTITAAEAGVPIPLTSVGLRMQVRQNPESSAKILDVTPYMAVTDAPNGIFVIDVPATVMAQMPFSLPIGFFYDIELIPSHDETQAFALLAGRFVILAEVTR